MLCFHCRRRNPNILAYHGSSANFDKFRSMKECGIHFAPVIDGNDIGVREVALHRIVQNVVYRADIKNPIIARAPKDWILKKVRRALQMMDNVIYQVVLDVSSLLPMKESYRMGAGFSWNSSQLLNSLLDPGDPVFVPTEISGVTEEEIDTYLDTIEEADELDIVPGEDPIDIYMDSEQDICEYIGKFLALKGFDSISYDNLFEGGKSLIVFDLDKITIQHKEMLDDEFVLSLVDQLIEDSWA